MSRPGRQWISWASDRGLWLGLVVLVVYASLASSWILDNDNAEFVTLGKTGGIAHPSGYPGYVLWLRAFSWLPGESPAHTAALATIVLAVAQVLALHAACRAWGAPPWAATIAVGLYAASPIVLRYGTEAEAFTPNQLAVSLVLWLSAAKGPLVGTKRTFVLGLVAGLGMTNHMTCTLVAPIGLLGVVRGAREVSARRWIPIAMAALGWCIGMLPYAYLFVAPENLLSWPRPTNLEEFLDIVLRRLYGGAFGFTGSEAPVPYGAHLGELVTMLGRAWLWALLPVGLATLGWRTFARREGEPRAGWILLAVCFLLSGPFLATQFNLELDDFGLYVVHRFHLLPLLFLVIPVSVGIAMVGGWVGRHMTYRPHPVLREGVPHLAFLIAIMFSLPGLAPYRTPAMQNMAANTLRSMPPNAVIMAGTIDELDVGIRYLQLALDERPDVLFIRWRAAGVKWYRDKFATYGVQFDKDQPYLGSAMVDLFHEQGRPVFVHWWEKELRERYPSYPFGTLARLLPIGEKAPSLHDVFSTNQELFGRFDLAYAFPGKNDQYATWVHRKYAGVWGRLSDDLRRAGLHDEAASAFEIARTLEPQKAK